MDDAPVPPGIRADGQARFSVAVIGLGSIGGVAAGCLRAADRHDVVACVRQPLERLTLERPEGTVAVELRSMTDPAAAAPVDWVLLCTKSHDTLSASPWLARLCRPSTRVAVLQNGIDHVSRVSPLIAGATVVPQSSTTMASASRRIACASAMSRVRTWPCLTTRRPLLRVFAGGQRPLCFPQRRFHDATLAQAAHQFCRQPAHRAHPATPDGPAPR